MIPCIKPKLPRLRGLQPSFHACCPRSRFSFTRRTRTYEDTVQNLNVTSETRVIFQGFTGRQATRDAKDSLEYGTNIVGGIKPGYEGEHLGLPVLPSIRIAKERLNPDATAVYIPAGLAASAITEAIEAEIPLIVAVAEHIPLHDMLRIQQVLRTQSKSRLVGANSPGMINPNARCRIGFPPIPFFEAGSVGIVAKSGTLSYETVASTTKAGLGQSLVIGIGGDPLPGTDFVDALTIFEHDENTKGIIIVGEIGGFAEEKAAEWIEDYHKRTADPKPIMALVAGIEAVPGRIMGHAGAFSAPGESSAMDKIKALKSAGAIMTDHPSKFGDVMKELLSASRTSNSSNVSTSLNQNRGIHTSTRPHRRKPHQTLVQRRSLTISSTAALSFLREYQVPTSQSPSSPDIPGFDVILGIDRLHCKPYVSIAHTSERLSSLARRVLMPLRIYPTTHNEAVEPLIHDLPRHIRSSLQLVLFDLSQIFRRYEVSYMQLRLSAGYKPLVMSATISFDDSAYRTAKRQRQIFEAQPKTKEEADAEEAGIVHIKLSNPKASIGTLVNGAGLAMNTIDRLSASSLSSSEVYLPANFLDTGGLATAKTVSTSLRILLADERVKAIFVNIFGGLTLCDMIAEGILLAYAELAGGSPKAGEVKKANRSIGDVPLVVRLRGTNEDLGVKTLNEGWANLRAEGTVRSEARLEVVQDFDDAVDMVTRLSSEAQSLLRLSIYL